MRHFSALILLASSVCLTAQTPDYKSDPKYKSAIAEGKQLALRRQYDFAIDAYKKANRIAQGKDVDTLDQIFTLQVKAGHEKEAVATADALKAIATNPTEKSIAEGYRGLALYQQAGDKGKPDLLKAADEALKAAIADDPKNATAHFIEGKVLARQGQNAASSDEFKTCVACLSPKDPNYTRAQHFSTNPALSLAKMAPAFAVTTLDGSHFNLDEMGGRVVLIDFWATWCGPCLQELPNMKRIAKEFASEPLVIISVSWDSDETKWKDFVNKNEMTWYQYRDANHALARSFGINEIPHYFTIDSDGVLTSEMIGTESNVEGKLKKLITKAKAARATESQSSGD